MKIIKILVICTIIVFSCKHEVLAQDTLNITIEQAEKEFLEKNLQLLAEYCNIDIADAAIVQAKLLNNPSITIGDINFWQPKAIETLGVSSESFANRVVFSVEIEQIIRTAGKRKKLVNLEKVAKDIAVQEFESFLLSLKMELRTILHETVYLQSYLTVVEEQRNSIANLVEIYKRQSSQGNISKSQILRLQSSFIELEKEVNEVQTELISKYKDLRVLLNIAQQTNISIVPNQSLAKNPEEIMLSDLFEKAKENRPEYHLLELNIQHKEKSLLYEKSLRSPDVGVKASYDRYGGVWQDFFGVGISVDIPLFNRNQGGIKMAKKSIEQANYNAEYQKNEIQQEIEELYNNYAINYQFYKKITENDFTDDLEGMLEVYCKSFLNKDICMLEYIDFVDAYKSTKQNILEAKKNLEISFDELQISVNSTIN